MRIHASGVGKTLTEALAKVREDLYVKARHASEAEVTEIAGVKVIDPARQVVESDESDVAQLVSAVMVVGRHVAQAPAGHLVRVLVVVNEDGVNSYGKVEVDLVRA